MNILIVDDESLGRSRLKRMVEKDANHTVIAEAENGRDAVEQVAKLSPDVVLMDIQMPEMDGIEAARHIAELETPPAIIFCTAYDEYAIEALNIQAAGYLLKPVRSEDLKSAFKKLKKLNKVQVQSLNNNEQRTHISAKTRQGLQLIPVDNIRLFRADQKYVSVFHQYGEVLIDDPLKVLEDEFEGVFVRVHRNALIAINHVVRMEKKEDGSQWLILEDVEEPVQVSRRHLSSVRKKLKSL